MSQFIAFLPPPGDAVAKYDRTQLHTMQPDSIPDTFREAMSIREVVYVNEQHVPLQNEFDSDDARSWHWVTFASVGTSSGPSDPRDRRSSTATRLALGTIRLVPPPHPPHFYPGTKHSIDNSENAEKVAMEKDAENDGPQSEYNPHNEPYIKLGRLAVLPDFRHMKQAKLLIDTALNWASHHPTDVLPPRSATVREQARVDGLDDGTQDVWKGLILVHAQKHLVKFWAKYNFKQDVALGEWDEEGITHVAMWRKIKVGK